MAINCISHNIKGFNSPIKRSKAFAFYKQLKVKIITYQRPPSLQYELPIRLCFRGKLISIAAAHNKANRQKIVRLRAELDRLYKNSATLTLETTRWSIEQKHLELDSLLSAKVEKALRWSKARFLLHSNTSSTMFARKLKRPCMFIN